MRAFAFYGLKNERRDTLAKRQIAHTYKDLAEITPYSARTWRRRVAQGKIRAIRDGNKTVVILQKDLEAYFEGLPEARGGESETTGTNQ